MREDLLGLTLDCALAILREEGISASVTETCAPRRKAEQGGVWRVVCTSENGAQLTVAQFLDPIADEKQEKTE